MPQLEAEQYARIALMIDELAPLAEEDGLPGKGNGFILDQVERKKQYGERMFMSPAQVNWIEALHAEHIGTAEAKEPKGVDEKIREVYGGQGDMDDDIPF